jgi:hypothetical protein
MSITIFQFTFNNKMIFQFKQILQIKLLPVSKYISILLCLIEKNIKITI